jgi:tetratricopeptide (TPR) repeat protein
VPLDEEPTPDQRQKLVQEARQANARVLQLFQQGRLVDAEKLCRQAISLCRRLYPRDQYPSGHADLANLLHNLGSLYQEVGLLERAESPLREALAMRRNLYPRARFPGGNVDLAASLNNLGSLYQRQGDLSRANGDIVGFCRGMPMSPSALGASAGAVIARTTSKGPCWTRSGSSGKRPHRRPPRRRTPPIMKIGKLPGSAP